jgi:hypothetical protein
VFLPMDRSLSNSFVIYLLQKECFLALEFFNCLQTGSGKTYTMLGEISDLEVRPSPDRGMTPRIFEFLFARIRAVMFLSFAILNDHVSHCFEDIIAFVNEKVLGSCFAVFHKKESMARTIIPMLLWKSKIAGRREQEGREAQVQLQVFFPGDI